MDTPSSARAEETEMRRLLVLDDEEIVLLALRETLVRAGYDVVATSDVGEALEALRRMRFATIITDQQMPRMTGLEFLAQAKVLRPDATRILITAVLNLGTVIEAINQGEIFRFIMKPWLRDDFLAAVESAVVRYRRVSIHADLREALERESRHRKALEANLSAARVELREREEERDTARGEAARNRDRVHAIVTRLLSRRDPRRARRTTAIAALCRKMAAAAEWEGPDARALEDAGWFQDLGFAEAGEGTREELPLLSGESVAGWGLPVEVRQAVETHRERLDGSGYPARLSGNQIPKLGCWLAVAVAHIEGRESVGAAASLSGIREAAGIRFDPEAVAGLEGALRQEGALGKGP